ASGAGRGERKRRAEAETASGGVFGDETIAAAILDRLLHHSHTLVIEGESYRLRAKKRAGLLGRET
ncbi:MAG TPA: ATP-binding protein, partial [Kofleriaceae bacterium]